MVPARFTAVEHGSVRIRKPRVASLSLTMTAPREVHSLDAHALQDTSPSRSRAATFDRLVEANLELTLAVNKQVRAVYLLLGVQCACFLVALLVMLGRR